MAKHYQSFLIWFGIGQLLPYCEFKYLLCSFPGSLEETVENLVKSWESEASHKADLSQWKTIDHDNYCISVNGGETMPGCEAKELGNYNVLMKQCPRYNKSKYCLHNIINSLIKECTYSGTVQL